MTDTAVNGRSEMVPQESKVSGSDMSNPHDINIDDGSDPNVKSKAEANKERKAKIEFNKLMIIVWLSRAIPIAAALIAFGYLLFLMAVPENWRTNEDADDSDKLSRTQNRGLFVSS